ncbi:MAG: class I SAM-dependent methyltransferase [Pseudomonadota bacterium]
MRTLGLHNTPATRSMLLKVGLLPVRDHYYEPQIDMRRPRLGYDQPRPLPGLDLNVNAQLAFLSSLTRAEELVSLGWDKADNGDFAIDNGSFTYGDAEFWYQFIRQVKPTNIIEIGSGNSTKVAIQAIAANAAEDPPNVCRLRCVEPYEQPWMESQGIEVARCPVEELGHSFFECLRANDVLFIDSSHVIRPEGDVVYEFLQLLPMLPKGVYVHVHDIFTPRNYPAEWLCNEIRLWNEQYLLEAFLTNNSQWEVTAGLNMLSHEHFLNLKSVCPFIETDSEPRSFYLKKIA